MSKRDRSNASEVQDHTPTTPETPEAPATLDVPSGTVTAEPEVAPEENPEAARFRREAEAHAERAERERLDHIAATRGISTGQLMNEIAASKAPTTPPPEAFVEPVPTNDPHVTESIKESDKAVSPTA